MVFKIEPVITGGQVGIRHFHVVREKLRTREIFYSSRIIFFGSAQFFSHDAQFWQVEDGWRFGGGSETPRFLQIDIYQYLTKKFCLRVEDGGTKRKKNPETVISNLKVDNSLLLKRRKDEFMSKNIRIFGVEAVWKQTILPPHLSNIYQSDGYKAVFLSVEGGGKERKNSRE